MWAKEVVSAHAAKNPIMMQAVAIRGKLERLFRKRIDPEAFTWLGEVDSAASATEFLRYLIEHGIIERGAEINAGQLGKALDVHRNTVSKALSILTAEGYIQQRAGRPARVVSERPLRRTEKDRILSHLELVRSYKMEMVSRAVEIRRIKASLLHPDRRAKVVKALEIEGNRDIIVYSRLRLIRGQRQLEWTPAIAETAYLVVDLLPRAIYHELEEHRIESIADYMQRNGFKALRSDYRIRSAALPELFRPMWCELARLTPDAVRALRFLRLESTVNCHLGPVEFSIADMNPELFAVNAPEVEFEMRFDGLQKLSRIPTAKVAKRQIG
jgi:DNA-binding GntR family transcriptional regulator